jgi:1,4-dihydroxy-2-naphthoate octaprenyltransferase
VSEARSWLLASRPATLWAAVVPVLVGGGLAWGAGREEIVCVTAPCPPGERFFRWDAFFVTLIAALAIQIAANFANDASDAKKGADDERRIGPTRAVASGLISARRMWVGVWVMLAVAAAGGIYLAVISSAVIILIGVVSVLATLGYVGGPRPYGYMGLGELFVFIFFGVIATVASRYVHDSSAPSEAWLLSIPIGFLVTAILVVNNIRDIETDAATGKRTLAVMLGRSGTARFFDRHRGGAVHFAHDQEDKRGPTADTGVEGHRPPAPGGGSAANPRCWDRLERPAGVPWRASARRSWERSEARFRHTAISEGARSATLLPPASERPALPTVQ